MMIAANVTGRHTTWSITECAAYCYSSCSSNRQVHSSIDADSERRQKISQLSANDGHCKLYLKKVQTSRDIFGCNITSSKVPS